MEAHLIRQREDEPLRDFIIRFTQECQKMHGLPESQQISGFTLALLPGGLQEKLTSKVPKTFKEAIDRAYDYIRSKETTSLVRSATRKEKVSREGTSRQEATRHESHRSDHHDRRRERKFSPYDKNPPTVNLVKCPREILNTERVCATFKPPPPMTFKAGTRNMNEYCEFHEDHGHDTNACRQLKLEIKRALDEGKLEHLVPGAKQRKKTQTKKSFAWQGRDENNDDPGQPQGHIYMIHGGEEAQGNKT